MNDLEAKAILEAEIIRAKADIAVAIINNATTASITGLSDDSKEKLIDFIKKAQKTIEN